MNWNSILREQIPAPCYERPFVCSGFPSDSTLIVIGENPATPMKTDWWTFWSDSAGFDLDLFLQHYLQEREAINKGISNTRRRLNRIRANGVAAVETNAFRNEALYGVGDGVNNYSILNTLIQNMPDLLGILAHGKLASDYLQGAAIPRHVKVFLTRHFRTESYETIDTICTELAAA